MPAAICIVYFTAAGALAEFIDGFLLINAEYNSASGLVSDFAKGWSSSKAGYGTSLWVIVAGLAALAIFTMLAMHRASRRAPATIHVAAIGAAALVGLVWSLRDFQGWPDAFVLLPLAAIGIGGIAKAATEHLSPKSALALTLAWVVFAVAIAVDYSTSERDRRLVRQRDSVEEILEQLPSDASILSIEAPQALVLSGMTNPTRHQTFLNGLNRYVDDTWPGGLQGFSEWIAQEQPTVIALGRRKVPSWIRETITTDYRRVGRAPGWTWYVHRSVAPRAAGEQQ